MSVTKLAWLRTILALSASAWAAAGCSVAGTWRTVDVSYRPEAAAADPAVHFDLSAVTFADRGRYTATRTAGPRRFTETGAYRFNGLALELRPDGGHPARRFDAQRSWRGELTLSRNEGDKSMSARLTRVDEEP